MNERIVHLENNCQPSSQPVATTNCQSPAIAVAASPSAQATSTGINENGTTLID